MDERPYPAGQQSLHSIPSTQQVQPPAAGHGQQLDQEVRPIGDDRVLAILREVARGRTSGVEVESRWGYVITLRDGRLARVEAYRDPARALEAAGLGE